MAREHSDLFPAFSERRLDTPTAEIFCAHRRRRTAAHADAWISADACMLAWSRAQPDLPPQRLIAAAPIVYLEETLAGGHFLPEEAPDETAESLLRFFTCQ